MTEIDHPAAYFQVTRTGRVHRVAHLRQMRHGTASWIAVEYVCNNITTLDRGHLTNLRPRASQPCQGGETRLTAPRRPTAFRPRSLTR